MTPDETPERTVFAEPPAPAPEPVASASEETPAAEPERTSEPAPAPGPVASAPEETPAAEPERTSEPELVAAPEPAAVPAPVPPAPEPAPAPVASAPEETPAAEPERTPEPFAAPWQPGAALLGVLGGVVVLLVAAVVLLSVLAVRTSGASSTDRDRRAALAASKAAAKLVFSYDYRHLPADFAKGKAVTTGAFAKEYEKTTSQVVSDVAPRYKTVVVADVSEAGVVRSTDRTVTVLMFVNQTSNSTLSKAPKITQSRVQMELTRTGGRWLVSKITAL